MGSVIVRWTGKCVDLIIQEYLCVRMKEMAELSHGFFKAQRLRRRLVYFNQGTLSIRRQVGRYSPRTASRRDESI